MTQPTTLGGRIRAFRKALGADYTQEKVAAKIAEFMGSGTTKHIVSKWEHDGPIDKASITAIAMLHPRDPWGCFEYLRGERAGLPRIHVDLHENTKEVLDAICSMLRASGACRNLVTTEEALDLLRGTEELQALVDQEVKRRGLG